MPRHRVSPPASPMTGSGGASSTPRLLDSITLVSSIILVSGILGSPNSQTVIASEAKQSMSPRKERMDCFVASAPRNDGGYSFAISRRVTPEVFQEAPALSKQRAQGRPGARCTRGLVCNVHKECAHEHTGPAESIRPSLRNGFTAYNALSSVSHALLPPSTPTSGRQDHTSLPYASAPFVKAPSRPPLPAPRFVTIASAPLGGTG